MNLDMDIEMVKLTFEHLIIRYLSFLGTDDNESLYHLPGKMVFP